MSEKQPRSSRRSFAKGVLTVAGAGTIAGCIGDNSTSRENPSESEPIDESPANETVNPNNPDYENSTSGNNTGNDTIGNGTDNGTVETPENPELTGEEIYFNWIHGEDEQILEDNKGENGEIRFNAVNNALENGFEQGGRNQAIANALETASQEYQPNNSYEDRHRHILSALHTTLEQKEGDQWNFNIFSMKDWGQSTAFPRDGINYSKVWVENEDGEYTNINAGLSDKVEHTTHIEGEEVTSRRQEVLQMLTDPESNATNPAHDRKAIENAIEYYENKGREYSDEDMEEINGGWIERLSNHIIGDGIPVPSSIEDWKKYHEGIETGPEVFLELNEAYHNSDYNGETAQFTIEEGDVSVEEVPEGYTPAEDGIPGNPAA